MRAVEVVAASDVREGDFIPGLDKGYVFEVRQNDEYEVEIGFHTADGDGAYVTCPTNMPVTVKRD